MCCGRTKAFRQGKDNNRGRGWLKVNVKNSVYLNISDPVLSVFQTIIKSSNFIVGIFGGRQSQSLPLGTWKKR